MNESSAKQQPVLPPVARTDAEKLRIIAEVDAVPDEQKREVSKRYGVSPMLVMSWKHQFAAPTAPKDAPESVPAPSRSEGLPRASFGRDNASYQLEIAMLKEDNRRLRRALAALLGDEENR